MRKVVLQEHGMGCGVACVAYVLDLSYKKSLALFAQPEKAWSSGYYCRDLIAALDEGGRSYKHFYYRSKHRKYLRLPGVIVFVRRSSKYPAGHYVARTKEGCWMNPWANFPVIHPVKGQLQKRLIGSAHYILVPTEYLMS